MLRCTCKPGESVRLLGAFCGWRFEKFLRISILCIKMDPMSFYLYITLGPLKGSKIRLRDQLTLGRQGASINLKDPKVSNIHAQISMDSQGQWQITDMASRNGIYHNGKRIQHLTLQEGMSIFIGDNLFTLKRKSEGSRLKKATLNSRTWRQNLLSLCNEIAPKIKNKPIAMIPFDPPLSLKVIQGIQTGTQWYMGHGPRLVGTNSLDFRIFGLEADCSFELHPIECGVIIKAQCPEMIRLNGSRISSREIQEGDIISVGEVRIRINFLI